MAKNKKRPTLADVARHAGVGPATVDRVINDRGNVSQDISKRVIAAARELDLKRILPQRHRRTLKIEVILARTELPLIARLLEEFRLLKPTIDTSIQIHRSVLKSDDPIVLANAMKNTTSDAVVVYVREHPLVLDVICELKRRNIPVVNLISDVPGSARIAYVGPDHYMSGRSAGYFITTMSKKPGAVIVLCSSTDILAQSERIRGLQDFLNKAKCGFEIATVIEGYEERRRSDAFLRRAFAERPDTVAVYNVGAANLGVAAAIRADILHERPIFIGHELTPSSAKLLKEGVMSLTIDQSPELQARLAITHIMRHFSLTDTDGDESQYNTKPAPIVLYGPENIPDYLST